MTDTALWRARPVFLTSTFRDMQAERDHLRDFVFPVLEERLRARREYLEPIDLRQGVETLSDAEAQVRELEVLKVCLEEVRRSRPFLIGLLGDRYGWIPPEERMKAAAEEAGFKGEVAGRSVTELEIAYGVLADAGQRRRSRFYFREPLPYESMSKNTAAEYAEVHNPASTSAEAQERLKALKTNIKEAVPERWRNYTATWDTSQEKVTELEAWGAQVLEDLWEDLEAETRESEKTAPSTWQGAERWVLEQFIESRARGFIGRETLRESLVALATTQSSAQTLGLSLTGVAGSGKSAVFARLYRDLEQKHGDKVLLLAHAAGTSPRAARIDDMLARWVEELATHLGIDNPLDENAKSEDIEQAFSALLGRASTQSRVVVLIDALDQLERTPRAQELTWLQKLWPPNARLITTAIPGKASQALSERVGVQSKTLGPLTVAEAGEVAEAIYARYHRRINPAVRAAVLEKTTPANEPACGNPLWLEMAVEALNLLDADDFARAERDYADEPDPQQRLQRLALDLVDLMPGEVDALYGWVLNRAQKLHGEAWTRAFVNLIAVSRAGWREQDFTQLIPTLTGEHWDELKFAALRRTLRAHVVQRGAQGQWAFVHQQLHRAVHDRYLTDAGEIEHLHTSLADYLEGLPQNDPLHESETMVHLIGADAALRAARYYGGAQRTTGELRGATDVLAEYILEHAESDDNPHLAWVLGLMQLTDLDDVTCGRLCHRFIYEQNDALENAQLALRWNLLEPTRATLERLAAQDPGNAGWQRDLSVSHERLGDVLGDQGDLNGALAAFRTSLKISERVAAQDPGNPGWQGDLSVSHSRLGNVLCAQGDLNGALAAYRASLKISERLAAQDPGNAGWQRDLSLSHNHLGDVLRAQGDLNGALAAFRAYFQIAERLAAQDPGNAGWQRDLSVSHMKLGDVLCAQGDLNGALAAYRATHAILKRLTAQDPGNGEWQHDLSISHIKLGDVLSAQGDLNGALGAFRASLKISERLAAHDPDNASWQRDLSLSHNHLGDVLRAQGDLNGGLAAYRATHAILERLTAHDPGNAGWQRDLSISHIKLGDVLSAQGDLNGALGAFRASLKIAARLAAQDPGNAGGQRDLSVSHDRLGDVFSAEGDLNGALAAYRASLKIAERLAAENPDDAGCQYDLSVSHERLGNVLSDQGDLNGALAVYRAALEIAARLVAQDPGNAGWQRNLSVSHNHLGDVLSAQGDLNGALAAYCATHAILERLTARDPGNAGWQRDLVVSHYKLATIATQNDDTAQANAEWARCRETLHAMRRAGMFIDAPLVQLLEQLDSQFDDENDNE